MGETVSNSRGRSMGRWRQAAAALALPFVLLALMTFSGCGGAEDESSEAAGTGQSASAPGGSAPGTAGQPDSGAADTERLPVLLDLGADKCVACKAMAPILDEMRETFAGQLDVRFIDVWKDAAAAREHDIRLIPTQIFFDEDGNELFRHQGFFSREDMLAKWEELGYDFDE